MTYQKEIRKLRKELITIHTINEEVAKKPTKIYNNLIIKRKKI